MMQAQTDAVYLYKYIWASLVPVFGIEFGVEALSVGCSTLTCVGFTLESRIILDGVLSLYFKSNEAHFSA